MINTIQNETNADLDATVCKRGHVGQWAMRKNGTKACKVCLGYAQAKFRESNRNVTGKPESAKMRKVDRLVTHGAEELAHLETQLRAMLAELEDAKAIISELANLGSDLVDAKATIAKASKVSQALKLLDGLE